MAVVWKVNLVYFEILSFRNVSLHYGTFHHSFSFIISDECPNNLKESFHLLIPDRAEDRPDKSFPVNYCFVYNLRRIWIWTAGGFFGLFDFTIGLDSVFWNGAAPKLRGSNCYQTLVTFFQWPDQIGLFNLKSEIHRQWCRFCRWSVQVMNYFITNILRLMSSEFFAKDVNLLKLEMNRS